VAGTWGAIVKKLRRVTVPVTNAHVVDGARGSPAIKAASGMEAVLWAVPQVKASNLPAATVRTA
jgi:hypothetical protein